MLRDALFLARKDLRFLFRERSTWIWAFVMPVIFFYFIGTVTGGYGRQASTRPAIAFQAPPDSGFMADLLAKRLEERGYRVVRVATEQEAARYTRRFTVPPQFTKNILDGKPMKVKLTRDGGGLDATYDQFRTARAVYSLLADLIAVSTDVRG
jgi:hypothetical protein